MRVKAKIEQHVTGVKVREISVGSTPTVSASYNFEGITEIRPGMPPLSFYLCLLFLLAYAFVT